MHGPNPNVRVEEQLHGQRTFHRSNARTGPTISPRISSESLMQPSHDSLDATLGGITSATGLPKRVTRTGLRVRRTSSRTARQVALNWEIAISRISNLYHG